MIIKIKNLRLKTVLGIYEWEENFQREIIINVTIEADNKKVLRSDAIKDTIDYDEIIEKIKKYIANNRVKLIEKMVGDIIDLIMKDKRIKKCQLEIDKVGVSADVDSMSVTEIRKRK